MQKRPILSTAVGAAGVGLALLVAGGCRTTHAATPSPGVTIRHTDGSTEISREIIFGTSRLARSLEIQDIRRRQTGHGLLNPAVTMVSTYGGTLQFEYRFSWFDVSGYEVGAETSSWKPVTLRNREARTVESAAPCADVKEFKLYIRAR